MAFSINHTVLVGNLTKDPELKYTPSGKANALLNVATNRSIKNQAGQYEDKATFHRVVVWGKMAEFVSQNLTKGMKVYIDGRIDNRSYQASDGQTKYISEVVADNVIPFNQGERKSSPAQVSQPEEVVVEEVVQEPTPVSVTNEESVNPEDIPF